MNRQRSLRHVLRDSPSFRDGKAASDPAAAIREDSGGDESQASDLGNRRGEEEKTPFSNKHQSKYLMLVWSQCELK